MSNMHKCIRGLAVLSLSALCIPQTFALGGTMYFFGSIVEPACSVNAQYMDPTTPATPGSVYQIPLNVRCNAGQSVQISVQSSDTVINNKIPGAGAKANILISHHAPLTDHRDEINYQFNGKKEMVIPLTATLRKATSAAQMHGNVLVSFVYH